MSSYLKFTLYILYKILTLFMPQANGSKRVFTKLLSHFLEVPLSNGNVHRIIDNPLSDEPDYQSLLQYHKKEAVKEVPKNTAGAFRFRKAPVP